MTIGETKVANSALVRTSYIFLRGKKTLDLPFPRLSNYQLLCALASFDRTRDMLGARKHPKVIRLNVFRYRF